MSMRPQRRGSGFTLLELLVVIAVTGILLGLTIPAVMRVRASADRLTCANNLKQIGLAAHAHHDARGRFPPAVQIANAVQGEMDLCSAYRTPSFGPNWAVFLLPFVAEENLYHSADVDAYLRSGGRNQQWRALAAASVRVYECPSDVRQTIPYALDGGGWARGNYAANAGPGWFNWSVGGESVTSMLINPSFVGDPNIRKGKAGGLMTVNWGANFSDLTDGASNTVLLNEVRVGISGLDRRGIWAMGLAGSSVTAANAIGDCTTPNDRNEKSDDIEDCSLIWYEGIGTNDRMGCAYDIPPPHNYANWQAQARSRHSGGVNACFADGSVRFVTDTIAQSTWFLLLSRNDGERIPNELP